MIGAVLNQSDIAMLDIELAKISDNYGLIILNEQLPAFTSVSKRNCFTYPHALSDTANLEKRV